MNVNAPTRGFIPELYSSIIYRILKDNLVLRMIAKAELDNKPTKEGDAVHLSDLADPTISEYTGTLTAEELKDSMSTFLIDKTKTFCFNVKDLDKLMSNADIKGSQTERAAYSLKRAIEREVFQYITTYANAGTPLAYTVTSANAISVISEVSRQLQENNVDEANMFMVIPPWFRIKLQLAGVKFKINEGIGGTGGMAWTEEMGFKTYVTNTVYNAGSQAVPISTIFGGSFQAIAYEDIMLETRNVVLSTARKTQVDGGTAHGSKLVKPKELSKLTATFAAETTI